MPSPITRSLILAAAALAVAFPALAQDTRGPITPPPKFEIKKVPATSEPAKPPVPAEEIIHRLAANEEIFKKAYDTYRLDQSLRVQELGDDTAPPAEFLVTSQVYSKADGNRYIGIVKQPETTLRLTAFSLDDVHTLSEMPLFFLLPEELSHYNLSYEGQEKLDELDTFIIRVKPKQIEQGHKLFDGVVWVDQQEFAIVKSYGQFVMQVNGEAPKFPFTMFEIYRENVAGKYWFPAYVRSDNTISLKKGELHLRLVIRSSNFQLQSAAAAPAARPASATPPASAPAASPASTKPPL